MARTSSADDVKSVSRTTYIYLVTYSNWRVKGFQPLAAAKPDHYMYITIQVPCLPKRWVGGVQFQEKGYKSPCSPCVMVYTSITYIDLSISFMRTCMHTVSENTPSLY